MRGCTVKRCELENGSFLPPYLQVYYSNLKLQGPVTPKGVMQPLQWSSCSWQREGRSYIFTAGHIELLSLVLLIPFPEVPQYLSSSGLYFNKIIYLSPSLSSLYPLAYPKAEMLKQQRTGSMEKVVNT